MTEYKTNNFDIERYKRRLNRAGANVTRSVFHDKLNVYTIEMTMANRTLQEEFPSSIELSKDGTLQMAQIRMPTFTVEPDRSGLTQQQTQEVKNSKIMDLWEEIKDSFGEIIQSKVGLEYKFGVVQHDHVNIRAQHGYDRINITPHIEFLRNLKQQAEIDKDELVAIVGGLNDLWQNEYFNVKVVDRSNIK